MVNRRTLLERCKAIFCFIENNVSSIIPEQRIPKSDFQKVGISPKEIEQWLSLIEYIQNQPRIRVMKEGKRTWVELLENRHMVMMRKRAFNSMIPIDKRIGSLVSYIMILANLEKIKGEEIDVEAIIQETILGKPPNLSQLMD
ncbi:MAG: hypothetical protein D6732_01260 [Methanobacteriota archaeon]|nr:MAG: hypothetical protein D6732_01260 [Euryarchaeota archaeon]